MVIAARPIEGRYRAELWYPHLRFTFPMRPMLYLDRRLSSGYRQPAGHPGHTECSPAAIPGTFEAFVSHFTGRNRAIT